MTGKKKNQYSPEDAAKLRNKVQLGALLVIRLKMQQKDAAKLVGVPVPSFNRYLRDGLPDGELWPEDQKSDITLENQYNQLAATWKAQQSSTAVGAFGGEAAGSGRDDKGRFTIGNVPANRSSMQIRTELEKLTPLALKKFGTALRNLSPQQDPALVLQFCNSLFDRVAGKPKQSLDLNSNTQTWEQYGWIGDIIQAGDEQSIRLAAQLAASMAGYARHDGPATIARQVEIVPPPAGAVDNIDPGSSGEAAETDH